MKIIEQAAVVLAPSDEMECLRLIERAARTCHATVDKLTQNSWAKFIPTIVAMEHDSPLEFMFITLEFTTDRTVMAELTRHRCASFCVESQRHVAPGGKELAVIRPDFTPGSTAYASWSSAVASAEVAYQQLIDVGRPKQNARVILPNCAATRMVMGANVRAWREIFRKRTTSFVYPPTRELMRLALDAIKAKLPKAYELFFAEF